MQAALGRIGRALNGADILWGVGASLMLRQYGLADDPRDIDLIVSACDAEKADALLRGMGKAVECRPSGAYATEFFRKYAIDGASVDLMAGFRIVHENGRYEYPFDAASLTLVRPFGGVPIPFAALEDWYVVYQLIPEKAHKAARIEGHFARHGISSPHLIERALTGCLPGAARARIEGALLRFRGR